MLSMFQVVRATSVPLSASPLITPLGSCRQLLGPLLCHQSSSLDLEAKAFTKAAARHPAHTSSEPGRSCCVSQAKEGSEK